MRTDLRGYMGFKILKNRFFHNFLYNSATCQEFFLKFQVNRSKILGERDFLNPLQFESLWVAFCFKRVFLKIVFLKWVATISQKLMHRSC